MSGPEPDAGTREHMNRGRHTHDLMRATPNVTATRDLQVFSGSGEGRGSSAKCRAKQPRQSV